jgi:ribosomal protein S18 acetylase RimI-like enzyme
MSLPVIHSGQRMGKLTYFKRYRMELDLRLPRPRAELPPGFHWIAWHNGLLEAHARIKYRCFLGETDGVVFPSLGHLVGCRDLMNAIATRPGFCPAATWLVGNSEDTVGTVQGLLDSVRCGGIQNLGVVTEYRGLGIGWALLLKALDGFASVGARRAFLEVTAKNEAAVRMYRQVGFRCYQTIYRAVSLCEPALVSEPVAASVGVGL